MATQAHSQVVSANDVPSREEQVSREHAAKEKAAQKSDEDSLTTILTLAQRTSLIVLLAAATASMRDNISATFDATATDSRDLSSDTHFSQDEKIMNPNIDPGTVDVEAHDRQKEMIMLREKELSAPKMQELKKDLLAWFDQWREAVIARVGEVLKRKKDARQVLEEESSNIAVVKPKVPANVKQKVNPKDERDNYSESIAEKADEILRRLYPMVETPLAELDEAKRILIMHAMLLIMLSLKNYAAPSRALQLYLVNSLKLPVVVLDEDEIKTAQGLLESTQGLSGDAETQKHAAAAEHTKKWKIGLATVAGAALVGVTGGMAAPLVAAGVGSVMGGLGLGATAAAGYLGSVAGSSLVIGGLFGAYGGKMTGKMMDNYAREVSDFAFIPLHQPEAYRAHFFHGKSEDEAGKQSAALRRLRVTIGISGWLTEKEEVVSPWRVLSQQTEVFALRWELESLLSLGNAMSAMISTAAWHYAKKEIISRTILADMMAAFWPLGLLQLGRLVDNPFSIAKVRAEKAGAVLADALINKAQGERPVTLIGYSLGARLIYSCLLSLAARKAFGLIDSVVLIGSPIASESKDWRAMRSVVSGRLVNVFSQNDYILGFLYRTSSIQLGVAGLQEIQGVHGVENVDVSDLVSGHLKYQYLVGAILHKIGFEDLDPQALKQEEEAFQKMEEEERQRIEQLKNKVPSNIPGADYLKGNSKNEVAQTQENEHGQNASVDTTAVANAADQEVDKLQTDVHEKTQKSLLSRGMEYLSIGQDRKKEASSSATADTPDGGYLNFVKNALPSRGTEAGVEKPEEQPSTSANTGYLDHIKASFPLGVGKSKSKENTATSLADPNAEPGQEEEGYGTAPKGKSYLEMVSDGGASVGSAASGLFSSAKSRLGRGPMTGNKQGDS